MSFNTNKVFRYSDVFDTMVYPAGEPHIRLKENVYANTLKHKSIIADCRNWNDLMAVRIGDRILKDNHLDATFVIPYLPFSRHDRKNDRFDSMPIGFVLEMLKGVDAVTVDPHSDVAGQLPSYPQSEVVNLFEEYGIFENNVVVAIPDAGATKKAYSWLDGDDVVQCYKTRDVKTGALSGFKVVDSGLVSNRNVIIIDDICDAGGTFLGLAKELKGAGALSLRLGVTHGLFTKGVQKLLNEFDQIYTLSTTSEPEEKGRLIHVPITHLIVEGRYF